MSEIDPMRDELLPLSAAAKRFPSPRTGRALHVSTIHRWVNEGVQGVRLKVVVVGGFRFTTAKALAEFAAELTRRQRLDARPGPTGPQHDDAA
ncbi:MAG: DUF1580 domain-containing protein [Planctomycetota bacterium JB042]